MADPYFSSVSLLLHCDGSDASTTFTDHSASAKTVTPGGNAQIDTAQSKWGGASALFDGSGDYLSLAASADFAFPLASAWTVEAWIRPNASTLAALFDTRQSGNTGSTRFIIGLEATTRTIFFEIGGTVVGNTGTAPATGAWSFLEMNYNGTVLRCFLNGTLVWSSTRYMDLDTSVPLRIGATYSGSAGFNGWIDDVRITKGVCRNTADYTPPTEAFANFQEITGSIQAPGPMQTPQALGAFLVSGPAQVAAIFGAVQATGKFINAGRAQLDPIFGSAAAVGWHDFTGQIDETAPTRYVMDLVTPGGLVRAPISSWQATLQTEGASYVQCVVPACTPWVSSIEAATEFVISRVARTLAGDTIEYEMARAPVQSPSFDRGSFNYTATVSGYADALTAVEDPPAAQDRTLTGIRTISQSGASLRARCDIDWLLRPGHRAFVDGDELIVGYVNYYCPGFDQYMDVGG